MSNTATQFVKRFPRGTFTPPQRAVLRELADLADQYGRSWPSAQYLMTQTELSERTIRQALNDLIDLGRLSKDATWRKNGSQSSNRYTIIGVFIDPDLPEVGDTRTDPVQESQAGVQEVHPQEEPSIDPLSSYEERSRRTVKRKPRRDEPVTELPDDWTPTAEHVKFADEHGYDLDAEAESFRSYHLREGTKQSRWNMAFSHWLRSPYAHHVRPGGPKRSIRERYEAAR